MPKIFGLDIEIPITESELKTVAVFEVLKWATLNEGNINEDFYNCMRLSELGRYSTNEYRDHEVKFTDAEKEIMQKEFKQISKILAKRYRKYREQTKNKITQ